MTGCWNEIPLYDKYKLLSDEKSPTLLFFTVVKCKMGYSITFACTLSGNKCIKGSIPIELFQNILHIWHDYIKDTIIWCPVTKLYIILFKSEIKQCF